MATRSQSSASVNARGVVPQALLDALDDALRLHLSL
jgi:hypothetical protein